MLELQILICRCCGGFGTERNPLEQEYVRKVLCFVVARIYMKDGREVGFPSQDFRYGSYVELVERSR